MLKEFDIATNTWTVLDDGTLPNNPGLLSRGAGAYSGGTFFIFGGRRTGSNTEVAQSKATPTLSHPTLLALQSA